MKWRRLAVFAVGVALALLLSEWSVQIPISSADSTSMASNDVVYAAQAAQTETTLACPVSTIVTDGCRLYIRCRITITPEGFELECEIGIECDFG